MWCLSVPRHSLSGSADGKLRLFPFSVLDYLNQVDLREKADLQEEEARKWLDSGKDTAMTTKNLLETLAKPYQNPLFYAGGIELLTEMMRDGKPEAAVSVKGRRAEHCLYWLQTSCDVGGEGELGGRPRSPTPAPPSPQSVRAQDHAHNMYTRHRSHHTCLGHTHHTCSSLTHAPRVLHLPTHPSRTPRVLHMHPNALYHPQRAPPNHREVEAGIV